MTAFHYKIHDILKEIRSRGLWLAPEDVTYSMKPIKMSLRMCNLVEPWNEFVEHYDRIIKTCEKLYRLELTDKEREKDLDNFMKLRDILVQHNLVQDTVLKLNKEIKLGKRILVEDCSSTQMDIDLGIYPYTESFYTTTGATCTGLGVPEEALETTIGVVSAVTLLQSSFHKRIR